MTDELVGDYVTMIHRSDVASPTYSIQPRASA